MSPFRAVATIRAVAEGPTLIGTDAPTTCTNLSVAALGTARNAVANDKPRNEDATVPLVNSLLRIWKDRFDSACNWGCYFMHGQEHRSARRCDVIVTRPLRTDSL